MKHILIILSSLILLITLIYLTRDRWPGWNDRAVVDDTLPRLNGGL